MNLLACARFEMNALESPQRDEGRAFYGRELKIKLDDLVSGDLANICHCDNGANGRSRGNSLGDAEVTVAERCVAEPVSERIERLALEVPIGPVGHSVIFKVRQLVDAGVEGNRQPPR